MTRTSPFRQLRALYKVSAMGQDDHREDQILAYRPQDLHLLPAFLHIKCYSCTNEGPDTVSLTQKFEYSIP